MKQDPSSDNRAQHIPKLAASCDLRTLPIGPQEAFLLSRIDGTLSLADLAAMTGLDLATILASTRHLAELGALVLVSPDGRKEELTPPPPTSSTPLIEVQMAPGSVPPETAATILADVSGSFPAIRVAGQSDGAEDLSDDSPRHTRSSPATEPGAVPVDDIDLDPEQRLRIASLFATLNEKNHYELLGVPSDADRQAIKRAYYSMAATFHPDRFFRKNLGTFKPQMEAIFDRATVAYETLASKERRAEYDGYLATQRETRSIEQVLDGVFSGAPGGAAETSVPPNAAKTMESIAPPPAPAVSEQDRGPEGIVSPLRPVRTRVATVHMPLTPPPEAGIRVSSAPARSGTQPSMPRVPTGTTPTSPLPPTVRTGAAPQAPVPSPGPPPTPGAGWPRSVPAPPPHPTPAPPGSVGLGSDTPAPGGVTTSSAPPRSSDADRERRVALARKLAGARGTVPPNVATSPRPPVSNRPAASAALDDLRRRQAIQVGEGLRSKVRTYVEAAERALANKDYAAAANAYHLAHDLDPGNTEIAAGQRAVAQVAAAALAEGYVKQGDYEWRTGNYADAGRSYVRAAAGMPNDAEIHAKAATALLRAGGDMHQAADLAKRAIMLLPKRLEPRLTLVEIYLATGHLHLAKREFEAAREAAPLDPRVRELAKRIK